MADLTYEGYRIEYIAMLANLLTEKGITPVKMVDWFSNAEKVVRCMDCKYYDMGECTHKLGLVAADDENYCSYGKKKE